MVCRDPLHHLQPVLWQRSGPGYGAIHWMLNASRSEQKLSRRQPFTAALEHLRLDRLPALLRPSNSTTFDSLPSAYIQTDCAAGESIERGPSTCRCPPPSPGGIERVDGIASGRTGMPRAHYKRSRGGPAAAATQSSTIFEIPPSSTGAASAAATGQSHVSSTSSSTTSPPQSRVSSQPQGSLPIHQSMLTVAQDTQVNLDLSPEHTVARKELLREAYFPDWKDDASSGDLGHPDEMQKNDPLATQIWKLYSKTKTQLPNQERMENLTWRMMAMSLKRKEREQAR